MQEGGEGACKVQTLTAQYGAHTRRKDWRKHGKCLAKTWPKIGAKEGDGSLSLMTAVNVYTSCSREHGETRQQRGQRLAARQST